MVYKASLCLLLCSKINRDASRLTAPGQCHVTSLRTQRATLSCVQCMVSILPTFISAMGMCHHAGIMSTRQAMQSRWHLARRSVDTSQTLLFCQCYDARILSILPHEREVGEAAVPCGEAGWYLIDAPC